MSEQVETTRGATARFKVGWIGLGAMGTPMARVTAEAGFSVTAYDVNRTALDALAPLVIPAHSAREAATGADVIVVMVATGLQLEDVLFGETGIAESLRESSIIMVMSTVGPSAIANVAERLNRYTPHLVDAPVSGGVVRAGQGDLLVMVGGSEDDVASVRPLLDVLASNAPAVGLHPGDGQRFKVVNQLLCGVHIAVAGEAMALADSMGLDIAQVYEVLGAGAAASFMFSDRGSRMINNEYDTPRSALDIFVKDMGIVGQAAREVNQPIPLAMAAEQIYVRGRQQGLGRKDDSIVFRLARGK